MLKTKIRPEVGEHTPKRITCDEFTQFCVIISRNLPTGCTEHAVRLMHIGPCINLVVE